MGLNLKRIGNKIKHLGGCIEWASDIGYGVSFDQNTSDHEIVLLKDELKGAVWINLANTLISDKSLDVLTQSSILESINVSHTSITITGVKTFIQHAPGIAQIDIVGCHIDEEDLSGLQSSYPAVQIIVS